MASYCPRPRVFKRMDAEPVFMLSRRINPVMGDKINLKDVKKKVYVTDQGRGRHEGLVKIRWQGVGHRHI